MKKLTTSLAIFLFVFLLTSCAASKKVKIEQKEFKGNTYEYVVSYNDKDLSVDDFKSLSSNTVYEIYNSVEQEIGANKRYIIITVKIKNVEKVKYTYVVNQSIEYPGLKLLSEQTL